MSVGWPTARVRAEYLENKLKFFPNIKEAFAFGASREFVCAIINIDPAAVANWAERNNVAYGPTRSWRGIRWSIAWWRKTLPR